MTKEEKIIQLLGAVAESWDKKKPMKESDYNDLLRFKTVNISFRYKGKAFIVSVNVKTAPNDRKLAGVTLYYKVDQKSQRINVLNIAAQPNRVCRDASSRFSSVAEEPWLPRNKLSSSMEVLVKNNPSFRKWVSSMKTDGDYDDNISSAIHRDLSAAVAAMNKKREREGLEPMSYSFEVLLKEEDNN